MILASRRGRLFRRTIRGIALLRRGWRRRPWRREWPTCLFSGCAWLWSICVFGSAAAGAVWREGWIGAAKVLGFLAMLFVGLVGLGVVVVRLLWLISGREPRTPFPYIRVTLLAYRRSARAA